MFQKNGSTMSSIIGPDLEIKGDMNIEGDLLIYGKVDGNISKLNNHMIHLAYDNVEEFIEKQKKYAKLSTRKKSLIRAVIGPIWTFIKLYVFKFGFLDGRDGFLISKIYAMYTFWKYYK